jgi:hypothetical protein
MVRREAEKPINMEIGRSQELSVVDPLPFARR